MRALSAALLLGVARPQAFMPTARIIANLTSPSQIAASLFGCALAAVGSTELYVGARGVDTVFIYTTSTLGASWALSGNLTGASATGFGGRFADRLRVRLNAPPVDGRANAALIDYLSDSCGVAKSQVVIEQGLAGRDKRVRIRGAQRIPSAVQEALDYS